MICFFAELMTRHALHQLVTENVVWLLDAVPAMHVVLYVILSQLNKVVNEVHSLPVTRHTVWVFARCIVHSHVARVNLLVSRLFTEIILIAIIAIVRQHAFLHRLCHRSTPFLEFFILELRRGFFGVPFFRFGATLRDRWPFLRYALQARH